MHNPEDYMDFQFTKPGHSHFFEYLDYLDWQFAPPELPLLGF